MTKNFPNANNLKVILNSIDVTLKKKCYFIVRLFYFTFWNDLKTKIKSQTIIFY